MTIKNPYDYAPMYEDETQHRQTINVLAPRLGVSAQAMYRWYNKNIMPRRVNILCLARLISCTEEEAKATITRAHAIIKAGHKLPYGLIIEKDMLKQSYIDLLNGKKYLEFEVSQNYST
ncbi:MAG: hypothetical protein ACP5N7_01910 [Candidatus Pacearchaeota archaeon]